MPLKTVVFLDEETGTIKCDELEIEDPVRDETIKPYMIDREEGTYELDENGDPQLIAAGYPSVKDQLDYIYHNGIAKWKSDIIKPVKDAHPKP